MSVLDAGCFQKSTTAQGSPLEMTAACARHWGIPLIAVTGEGVAIMLPVGLSLGAVCNIHRVFGKAESAVK